VNKRPQDLHQNPTLETSTKTRRLDTSTETLRKRKREEERNVDTRQGERKREIEK
jgi:hypothetical protein